MMCQKQSYRSKQKAMGAAYAIKCKGRIGPREALYPYFCKTCQKWHLSKMNNNQWFNQLK